MFSICVNSYQINLNLNSISDPIGFIKLFHMYVHHDQTLNMSFTSISYVFIDNLKIAKMFQGY